MDTSPWKRQYGYWHDNDDNDDDDDDDGRWWGYSPTATAVKWSLIGALLLLVLIWLIGGYYHARRRVKKGQTPLPYHRFLLPRHQRVRHAPQPPFTFYQQGYSEGGYPIHAYPPPGKAGPKRSASSKLTLTAYNAEQPAPPVYQPPEGGSKVNSSQDWIANPPLGPPPAHANAGESSSATNHSHLNHGTSGQQIGDTRPQIQGTKPGLLLRLNPFK
ncbi:MAG: hypothetical protein Q9217_001327 [Psora testacea]